jgi:uncharacterized protein
MTDTPPPNASSNEWLTRGKQFQILSLDGGGIKGLFSAAVLAAIEEDLNTEITKHFDLIAGTSTGGIIALGLGLGLRPREIVEFYVSNGPTVFKKRRFHWARSWTNHQYPSEPLVEALKGCFNDRLFGKSQNRLVIPSYNIGEDDVYIFRTPHHVKLRRDYKVPAWKVAQATSAAPTYFPSCRSVDQLRLIDGGVWANNPALVALVEATGTLGVPMNAIRIFSIGTSDPVTSRPKTLDAGGKLTWVRGNDAIDVIMRGQSIGVNNQVTFLLGKDRVERLDPRVPPGELSLDAVHKSDDLIAKARHHSRIFTPTFEAKFLPHIALEYKPIYT